MILVLAALALGSAVAGFGASLIPVASYSYTSGDLAGPGAAFEDANHTIYSDGFTTTQADVDAAAGNPRAYYVNGTSPQPGHIVGRPGFDGDFGVHPQPGVLFDLGAPFVLSEVKVHYANLFGDGVSSPARVEISVEGGAVQTFEGFDRSHNVSTFGDARVVTIDLAGKTGQWVQMDFYNPRLEEFPDGEWTAISEIQFFGTLVAQEPPTIVQHPVDQSVLAGTSVTFTASARGTEPLEYQWLKGGAPVAGATGSTYQIPAAEVGDAGTYTLRVTNRLGSATSNPATLTVDPGLPVITTQPVGRALETGFSLTLRVAATGRQPLAYQWTKGGEAIAGATENTYAILHATSVAAGDYRAIVSNVAGSATSDPATVAVSGNPPIAVTSYVYTSGDVAGDGATFEKANRSNYTDGFATTQDDVEAAAGAPVAYYVNGTSTQRGHIVGRPGLTGEFGVNPQPGVRFDLGAVHQLTQVRVFYANRFQDGVSSPASVQVSVDGGEAVVFEGFDREHNLNQYGDAREVAIDLAGKTGQFVQMDFYNPRLEDFPDGEWTAISEVVFYGSAVAQAAPKIVQHPAGLTVIAGSSVTFSAVASGTAPLSYQWKKGQNNVEGATADTFTIPVAEESDSGQYVVVVSNAFGSATSDPATLVVEPGKPVITQQPADQRVIEDGQVTFSVQAKGATPIGYQWRKGTAPIPGADQPSYTIASAQLTDQGAYSVELTNARGSASSTTATLTVDVAGPPVAATSYSYTSGDLAGPGAEFEYANLSHYSDGFATTQADVEAAKGQPLAYYVNGTSAEPGHIVGRPGFAGDFGVSPQPGVQFALSAVSRLTHAKVHYANHFGHGVSSPGRVEVSVDAGAAVTFAGFDRSHNVGQYGDARVALVNLTGQTGQTVQMDFYNPRLEGFPDGEWTAISEIQFFGIPPTPAPPLIMRQPKPVTAQEGESAAFSVSALAVNPLSYQWRKDGNPINGANSAVYALAAVQPGDAGDYSVVVTSAQGSVTSDAAKLTVEAGSQPIEIVSYTYTSGTLAGAGGAFETENRSIYRDGFATTQADVDAAAGNPRAYYVNGTSAQRGHIVGGGDFGARPQPGLAIDLGAVYDLAEVTVFYANLFGDGVSSPARVEISVEGGPVLTFDGFDLSANSSPYGDARSATINLAGRTGRYVQMDFYNPRTAAPGGEWTSINEIRFRASTPGNLLSFSRTGNQLTLSWAGGGFVLQESTQIGPSAAWTDVPGGNASPVVISIPASGSRFYQLRQKP